jgi:hypothetical protein
MVELAEQLVDAGHAYVERRRQRLLRGLVLPVVRRPVREHLDALRAGHRGEVEATSAIRRTSRSGRPPARVAS